jgi:hypothetical protein
MKKGKLKSIRKLADLAPDRLNTNVHTERGLRTEFLSRLLGVAQQWSPPNSLAASVMEWKLSPNM